MRKTFIAVAAVLVGVSTIAFARYGTIAPCGMLRSEAKRHILASMLEPARDIDGFEMIGLALGVSMIDSVSELYTASLTPIDCAAALVRLHTDGLPTTLSTELAARMRPSNPASSPPVEVPPPEWRFITTKDPITDDAFSRATIVADDNLLYVYLNDNRFHVGIRGDRSASYDAKVLELRVDSNPAFTARIFSTENDYVYATLSESQVAELSAGTELLVRYDSITGDTLLRVPLRGAAAAIALVGKPTPPPPRPRPDYNKMPVDERIALWMRQHNSVSRSMWRNCRQIEIGDREPETASQKEAMFGCISKNLKLE